MTDSRRLLVLAVCVEIVIGFWLLWPEAPTFSPPVPEWSGHPSVVRIELQAAIESTRVDEASDWSRLGELYFASGFYSHAELCHRRAVELQPDQPKRRFEYGFVLSTIGQTHQADAQFLICLDSTYRPADCHYFLGMHALRRSEHESAVDHFQQARR